MAFEDDNGWLEHLKMINNSANHCYEELREIWKDCGYSDEICYQRRNVVVNHVQALFSEMIKEETAHKNHLINKVEEALKEITSLSKELHCEIPTVEYENLPLNKMEKALRRAVEQHRLIKDERMRKLAELKRKERQLCDIMGIDPVSITQQVPSEEDLANFEEYLNRKHQEQIQLENIFAEKRAEVLKLMAELEWIPSLQFEKSVTKNDGSFVFSKTNMAELENLVRRLDQELKERKSTISELQNKITELWDRLSQDLVYREKFLSNIRGFGQKTVDRMKNEIARLEEIKRQNIKRFVEYARRDLEEWWVKCHFSEDQKMSFIPYQSNCYTEDLLELHELEVQRLKDYYESNGKIFELVQQRQDLWDKMLDIENRTHDKNRLFGNRGGQLLQEERERKQIQKDLPKIEAILLKYLKEYEVKYHTSFLLNGEILSDVIGKQWKEHQALKEQEKLARKRLRDQESAVESRFGARSVTKDSIGKRKRCDTPTRTPQSSKHPKVMSSKATPCTSVVRSGKTIKSQDTVRHRKAVRKSLRLSGHSVHPGSSNTDGVLAKELSIASTAFSYTHFEGELLNKESECRSSVKPEAVRVTPAKPSRRALTPKNFNTPKVFTTQLKTPNWKTPQSRTPAATSHFTTPRVKLPVIF